MKFYALAMTAYNTAHGMVGIGRAPRVIQLPDGMTDAEVYTSALSHCHSHFQPGEGWGGHAVSYIEFNDELILAVAEEYYRRLVS